MSQKPDIVDELGIFHLTGAPHTPQVHISLPRKILIV